MASPATSSSLLPGRGSPASGRIAIFSAYPAASRYGISDSALHSLSMNVNASSEISVTSSMIWMRMLVITSAGTGTSRLLALARKAGISLSLAATKSTSAAIMVHARYAPSTEMITPTLMNTSPQWPTTDSIAPAIDGCRRCSSSALDKMP